MAFLWSLAIPGFGQLYNTDYFVGLILVILELVINVKANLNLAILYSFKAQVSMASQAVNYQWLLFYPCIYSFSLWHAYNRAREINRKNQIYETKPPIPEYNGALVGSAFVGTLGIVYHYAVGPVFGGLIGMAAGMFLGWGIEGMIAKMHKAKAMEGK